MSFYDYCPKCGAIGVTRERRPDGNDVCENGHTYKSTDAVQEKSVDHDIMLHGVLRMPVTLWSNDALDMYQRHARYIQASDRIIELENKLAAIESVQVPEKPIQAEYDSFDGYVDSLINHIDTLRELLKQCKHNSSVTMDELGEMRDRAEAAEAKLTEKERENEALRKLLVEAAEDIEDWGAYASEYFQKKHDLEGNVKRYRDAAIKEQSHD